MININTNSWHYKLVHKMLERRPKENLCPYVRQVLKAIVVLVSVSILFIVLGFFLLLMLLYPILQFYFGSDAVIATGSVVIWVLFAGAVDQCYKETDHYDSAKKFVISPKQRTQKQKPLFRLWLEAKHDKICPQLTFED